MYLQINTIYELMKYLKKFEKITHEKKYWLIPTDNRLKKSLRDIGLLARHDQNIIDNDNVMREKYIFTLLVIDIHEDGRKEY